LDYPALVGCYLLGAIPFGLMVGKITRGVDIRDFGSGNIGATNVLRTLGLGPALAVGILDTVKGTAAVVLCQQLKMEPWMVVTGGVLSIVGHSFSVFLKFRGGKGVATSLGMIIGLNPMIAGIAFGLWLAIVAVTRIISVASIIAAISVPVMMFVWEKHVEYQAIAVIAALLIVVKHRSNMKRLFAGTEARVGQRVKVDSEGDDGVGK
jgi:acyl phosphate:glycerol-3-phosphate acyltransferase